MFEVHKVGKVEADKLWKVEEWNSLVQIDQELDEIMFLYPFENQNDVILRNPIFLFKQKHTFLATLKEYSQVL